MPAWFASAQKFFFERFPITHAAPQKGHVHFLNFFSLVAILGLLAFGVDNIVTEHQLVRGIVELIFAVILLVNIIVLRHTQDESFASLVGAMCMSVAAITMIFTGGLMHTGIYWLPLYPLLIFLIVPKKWAFIFAEGLFFVLVWLAALQYWGYVQLAFNTFQLFQIGVVGALISLIAIDYVYERDVQYTMLERAQKTLDAVVNAMPVGVLLLSAPEGKIMAVNSFSIRLFGDQVKPESLISVVAERRQVVKQDGTLYPLHELPGMVTLRTGNPAQITDAFLKNPDGTLMSLFISSVPIITNGLVGSVVIFQDRTKEFEIDRAKTEFVSLASHQLRSPLVAMGWYSEVLLDGDAGKLKPKQESYVRTIYESEQRMAELVDALLNVSRLELGTFMVEPESIDVGVLVQSVIEEQYEHLTKKQLVLREHVDKKIPRIMQDKKMLRIIFENLLSNAIKYTPACGTVSFDVKVCDKGERMADYQVPVHSLCISVSDTGCGIPLKDQSKIFTKLFRAENAKKLSVEGTGLGLYLVQSIVKRLGGEVWFTTAVDEGSTFYVVLPIKKLG